MSLNNFDEALVFWRCLIDLDPINEEFYARMGTTYNLLNCYNEAEKYFLKSISISPSEYAYKHLGICYAKLNNYEKAYDSLKNIAYNCNDFKMLADFAFCRNELKKFDESILILKKCLKINRNETISSGMLEIAYNEKGVVLAKKNKLQQSVIMFKSAIAINSNFDLAKSNLSKIKKFLLHT